MPYITNTNQDRKDMLEAIGVDCFSDLLDNIPEQFKLNRNLNISKSSNELEIKQLIKDITAKNKSTADYSSFLGAGSYDHYSPDVIKSLVSRPEFRTAYTPYQAEVSQGTLQAIYEYQSMVCSLTGMYAANASMYDGASSLAEAIILATNSSKKKDVIIAGTLHPIWKEVLVTYLESFDINLKYTNTSNGLTSYEDYEKFYSDQTAAIVVQTPNFFGNIEDLSNLANLAHSNKKGLFIVSVDPTSLGMLEKPANYLADIVVAEGQSLGIPQSFGGPYLGIFATTKKLMRKIPGRIVGVTKDDKDNRGFVLTLQTREQHIRRDKATSNICSNQALIALSSSIYMSLLGEKGFAQLAENCYQKSHYLASEIAKQDKFELAFPDAPFFKEFTVKTSLPVDDFLKKMKSHSILAGIALSKFNMESDKFIVAVTEKRSKDELDAYIDALKKVAEEL